MMKNQIIYILGAVILLAVSCKKDFLSPPTNNLDLTPQTIFNDEMRTSGFLANIYANMYNEGIVLNANAWGYSTMCDEVIDPIPNSGQAWVNGSMNSQVSSLEDGLGGLYISQYPRIRRCNLLLKYQNLMTFTPASKTQFIGETRFLRAFFYFELLKRYGGVPLVTDATDVSSITDIAKFDEFKKSVSRASFKRTVDFILEDLEAAKSSLTWFPATDNDRGRATAAAASALKSRLLLYAASPLFNTSSEKDTLISYGDYDVNRWKLAADAAREFFTLNSTNGNAYQLYNSYPNLFTAGKDATNHEIIWYRQNFPYLANVFAPGRAGSPGNFCFDVTANEVDLYETNTGKTITETGTNYDPANPFANRDPRLGYNVVKNGDVFNGFTMQLYNGGADYSARTVTGVFIRKGIPANGNVSGQKWHYIRLAEIYLNLAEAINEYQGPTAEAYAAINATRTRPTVNMPVVVAGLTADQFRTKVQRERSVELAFESQRFFDLRRWRSDDLKNEFRGYVPVLSGSTVTWTNALIYSNFFDNRMYFYPFPFNETLKSPNLKQNPGY
jgi:hypothetical protein